MNMATFSVRLLNGLLLLPAASALGQLDWVLLAAAESDWTGLRLILGAGEGRSGKGWKDISNLIYTTTHKKHLLDRTEQE